MPNGPAFASTLHFDARNASNESALLQSSLRLGLIDRIVAAGAAGIDQDQLADGLHASKRQVRALVEMLLGMKLARREKLTRVSALPSLSEPLQNRELRALLDRSGDGFSALIRLEQIVRTGEDKEGVLAKVERAFRPPELPPASLELWKRFSQSAIRTAVLIAAARLDLFEAATKNQTTAELARTMGYDAPALSVLKGALEAMGVLAPGEPFRYSADAAPVFDQNGRAYFKRSMEVSARYWDALSRLDETVLKERYVLDLKDPAISAEFYADNSSQISAVFASHFKLARQAAQTLKAARPNIQKVLDIGTGSGVWGGAFAATFPAAQVTYFDQQSVLPQVKENLTRLKLEGRAELRPGNLFADDFGEGIYDVVILPQVLNVLVPADLPKMIARASRALKPDGVLAIAEYVLTDERDGPLDYLYFQFRRAITNEGDLLSFPEYAHHCAEVGLTQSRCYPLPTQELILATRAGGALPENLTTGHAGK